MKHFLLLSGERYRADSDRFERFSRGDSRLGIVDRRSCRTLNELNQLVGRHSMIHLLCVQILAFLSFKRVNGVRLNCSMTSTRLALRGQALSINKLDRG